MQVLNVDLAERSYPIYIGHDVLQIFDLLKNHIKKSAIIITDETVAPLHANALEQSLRNADIGILQTIAIPAGESSKSFSSLETLCNQILECGIDRHTTLIALGGGVIGDLTGFAAAILLRGIPFIQIPTTLLAQVDSSVGGKTAISTPAGKNLIGAFNQPRAVLIDLSLLDTLPDRHMRAGYAEIVKLGFINDADFFVWCEMNAAKILARDPAALEQAVLYSCRAKAAIVAEDEREETGLRALLNLGHTFGHAFEAEAGFSDKLLHGEAVALGIVQAFKLSAQLGLCSANDDAARVRAHFDAIGLPTNWRAYNFDPEKLIAHMYKDKKAENNQLNFVLADGIGKSRVVKNVSVDQVRTLLA